MKHGRVRRFSAVLALLTVLSLFSCGGKPTEETPVSESGKTRLTVGFPTLGSSYNPFFVTTECEEALMGLTQVRLLELDRSGEPIMLGIGGETRNYGGENYTYKGICDISVSVAEDRKSADYTVKLREGLKFSDGSPLTVEDVIFSFYVVCDPTYKGSSKTRFSNIKGLGEYLTQTDSETYEKAYEAFDRIRSAGYGHLWNESDDWTSDEQEAFDAAVAAEWKADLAAVTEYCVAGFSDEYGYDILGLSGAEIVENPEYHVAFAMAAWGFATVGENGILTTPLGAEFNIKEGDYPTPEDFYSEVYTIYGGDPEAYWNDVNGGEVDSDNVTDAARLNFISAVGGGGVVSVIGITKRTNFEFTVTTDGYDTGDIYDIFDFYVAPKSFYGTDETDTGVILGDLSTVTEKSGKLLGAGQFTLDYSDKASITLKKNPNYYGAANEAGVSVIRLVRYSVDGISSIAAGSIDLVTLEGSSDTVAAIEGQNSGGTLSGDRLTAIAFDSEYYGYVGINAEKMKVGKADSPESLALRRGFATLFAVYRDAAVNSYYGGCARVVDYPVSSGAYFVPKAGSESYGVAFSKKADGSEIYTEGQNAEAKYSAALSAAKEYFIAAGFEYDSATGKFVSAPEGLTLEFEVIVPGEGKGDHPAYAIMKKSAEALASVNITLKIKDPASSSSMWEELSRGDAMMWCAAKTFSPEPDLYRAYHSGETPESGGENYSRISDETLDRLIAEASSASGRADRQVTYRQCLDIILDWAVEIPLYRRQFYTVYSTESVASFPKSLTSYYKWYREANSVVLK